MNKKIQRFLSFTLTLIIVICMMPAPSASAVTMTGGEVLYFKPNSNWTQNNARFAAYFFGTGNTWVSMVHFANGIYAVKVPAGNWTNVIFCRMNPGTSANNWDNKWNQTGDLTYDGTKNLFTQKSGSWDGDTTTWSKYTYSLTVAGDAGLCGVEWSTDHTANDMVLQNGVYVKTFTAVAAGTHKFKVVLNHTWDVAWPSSDYELNLAAKSNVTITFDPSSCTVSVSTSAYVCPHENQSTERIEYCNKDGYEVVTCSDCGEELSRTTLPATGKHNYVDGICTSCGDVKAVAIIGQTKFPNLQAALDAALEGDTIQLVDNATADALILMQGIDLDLNGFTVTVADNVAAYPGSQIVDSIGTGLLTVNKDRVLLQKDNGYLPIWNGNGSYVFRDCKNLHSIEYGQTETGMIYQFLAAIGTDSYQMLAAGRDVSGVDMMVVVSWDKGDGTTGSATFTYTDVLMQALWASYDAETNTFGQAFTLSLGGIEGKENLTFTVCFESDTGVLLTCRPAA